MTVIVEPVDGEEMRDLLPRLAELRIEVFRAWPYLYDGDEDYERRYLRDFASSDRAMLVAARDDERLVGASTAAPLSDHADDFRAAFEGSGIDMEDVWYMAESVLLPDYRGRGIGRAFFEEREARGRMHGYSWGCFCSVVRPDDHPMKPADYRPLDAFWEGRGYRRLEGVVARFPWKDVGDDAETEKPLQFWGRRL